MVIRDKRRIDPQTGNVRDPSSAFSGSADPGTGSDPSASAGGGGGTAGLSTADSEEFAKLTADLAERTADLQRVTAEYANYRKRVLRDQEALSNNAKAAVAGDLLPVLDDLELARAHGDLNGAFKSVAERLIGALERVGLIGFGAQGDPFDPAHHEAVQFGTSADVTEPTVTTVLRRGYSFKDRTLRAAVVVVTGPEQDAPVAAASTASTASTAATAGVSAGESTVPADVPTEDILDFADRADDQQARAEQESKQTGAPDLGDRS